MADDAKDDYPITKKGLAAADEVLKNWTEFTGEAREQVRAQLAKDYSRLGTTTFRLYFNLRSPRTWRESLRLKRLTGAISSDEFKDCLQKGAVRSIDKEMLDTLSAELEQRVKWYGRFLRGVDQIARGERLPGEIFLGLRAKSAKRRMAISPEEIRTVCNFLSRVRASKSLGPIRLGNDLESNAFDLAMGATRDAWHLWCQAHKAFGETPWPTFLPASLKVVRYFRDNCFDLLPSTRNLLGLLNSDHALGLVELESSQDQNDSFVNPARSMTREIASHSTDAGTVPADDSNQDAARKKKKTPLLKVDEWSALALGVDEKRRVWAITPPPGEGAVFEKQKSVRIGFRRGNGRKLLELLANSTTGKAVPILEVAIALDLLPPSSSVPYDSRGRRESVQEGHTHDLSSKGNVLRRKLNSVLSEVGRSLRRSIDGPIRPVDVGLSMDDKSVNSGFIVRHLLRDNNRFLRFGHKPS